MRRRPPTRAFPRQPVATHGNGFRVFRLFSRPSDLPPLAIGCDRWAVNAPHSGVRAVRPPAPEAQTTLAGEKTRRSLT
jgi:hypothetical protein